MPMQQNNAFDLARVGRIAEDAFGALLEVAGQSPAANRMKRTLVKRANVYYFGHRYPILTDRTVPLRTFGSEQSSYSLWCEHLGPQSIVYSLGVGNDIDFDVAIIRELGVQVFAFDPTEESRRFLAQQKDLPPQFHFQQLAVGRTDSEMVLSTFVEYEGYRGGSLMNLGEYSKGEMTVPVRRLGTVMAELGHKKIDLLKIDIEGGEYDMLEDVLGTPITPTQLVLEFHPHLASLGARKRILDGHGWRRTAELVHRIRESGYHVVSFTDWADVTFIHHSALE